MAKADVLDILRAKKMDPLEFHFENLWIPPMHYYLSQQDIDELHHIATSVRLSSKIRQKYDMIDAIMTRRGFKRFSAGTNRVVYRFLDDTRFLVKIAVDKVGMQDNPLEYKNQFLLQPFVTKMFYVSPCGTVGFSERVLPIKNRSEFKEVASDVFDILVNKILGLYVVEDVGTKYFMNWGIRSGFGPVLLDYPYVYKLDGNKLFCNSINPDSGLICDGEIDYDEGFNHLVCSRCGKIYLATNLRDESDDNNLIIKKGGNEMRIIVKKGDTIIDTPIPSDEVMRPNHKSNTSKSGIKTPVIRVRRGSTIIENNNCSEEAKKSDENHTNVNAKQEYPKPVIDQNITKPEIIKVEPKEPEIIKGELEEPINVNDLPVITSKFIREVPSNPEHVVEDESNEEETDETSEEYNENTAEDDEFDQEEDDIFASDIDVERRNNQARMERNNSMIANDNNIYNGKKNKKNKKNKHKNNYIPNTDAYRRG